MMQLSGRVWAVFCLTLMSLVGSVGPWTQRAAAASGHENQVAYLRNGDIYLLDLPTNQTTQITKRGDIDAFAWSPDGNRIAIQAESDRSSDIFTMNADGNDLAPAANSKYDESSPAYSPAGTLYYVQRITDGRKIDNRIMAIDASTNARQVYSEPGGLCHITRLSFFSDKWVAVSRDCGRGKNVSVLDISTGGEAYFDRDKCVQDAVWSTKVGVIATRQTDCDLQSENEYIAFYFADGTHVDTFPRRPGSSLDITSQTTVRSPAITMGDNYGLFGELHSAYIMMVVGNESGLWLVSDHGDEAQISSVGGVPRWRPTGEQPPATDFPTRCWNGPCNMPKAGEVQANDLLAWGALAACIAIIAGIVLISRRRRKDRDGL